MTDLNLRAYVKQIDSLVEQSRLDEAIAHCRYILQTYPKHLETYRLLGKAYLEAKRYGDASDIFQRVLSAVPDDFVSHIGMAIVREDDGNLESAIWHMERAFETNPANPAIQQELKRLIGRRDNVEPHKVRLTRGALARMYAQGELYPQAIAELRGALQDDPERPDLLVLLARMFWKTNQWTEAADVCNRTLEKLPYCREANKIMAVILQANNKTDEAGNYHRRLAALDPYAAYVEKATIDPQTVDSSSVTILELDWQPGQPLPSSDLGSKNWSDSLGVEIDSSSPPLQPEPEKPSWVEGMRSAAAAEDTPPASSDPPQPPVKQENQSPVDAPIPEWMQDAGWQEASGEAVEGPVSFSDQELDSLERGELPVQEGTPEVEDELTPAEIPSWLQDIAPSEQSAKGAEMSAKLNDGPDSEKLPDWLSDIAEEADDVTPDPSGVGPGDLLPFQAAQDEVPASPPVAAEEPYDEPDTASAVPTWLEESKPGATDTIVGWLGDLPSAKPGEAPTEEEMPSWVQPETAAPQAEPEEIPTWIGEAQSSDRTSEAPPAAVEADDAAPDWLSGIAEETDPQSASPSPAVAPQQEEAPDWLQGIAEESQAAPEMEAPPEWLSESAQAATTEAALQADPEMLTPEDQVEEVIPSIEEIPGWLAQEAAEAGIDTSVGPPDADWRDAAAESAPDLAEPVQEIAPEWLQESEAQAEMPSAPPATEEDSPIPMDEIVEALAPAEELADPPPPWLQKTAEPENMTTQEIYPIPDELKQAAINATSEIPEGPDDDEVFRWLEGLAARQGADESQLTTPEVQRPTEPPAGIGMEDQLMVDESQAIPEEPEQGLDWLEQLASERGLDVEVEPSSDMAMMSQPPEPVIEEPQHEPETASEAPDWLQEMQTGAAEEPTLEQEPAQTEVEEPIPAVETPAAPIEAPAEAGLDTEAPPWLEEMAEDPDQIAEETGSFADVAAQLSAVSAEPEVEPAEPKSELDWLSSADAEPVEAQAAVDEDISATDWLNRMADDTGEAIAAPQVMMAEQDQLPVEEPVATPPADVQDPVPQPAQPTPDLAEEIAAEVNEFWTAEDGEGPVTPEPVSEEIVAPSQAGSPLETAHLGLEHGDIEAAVAIYAGLIQEKQDLDGIIAKLSDVLSRDPNQAILWQTLGDAYMNNDQLNEAIEAYQKGTEVV